MINTLDHLEPFLQGTVLETSDVQSLPIDQSDQLAFAIAVPASKAMEAWQQMRSQLAQTGRYPVITDDVSFSRFFYEEEVEQGMMADPSPNTIIVEAATVDLPSFLDRCKTADYLEEELDYSLEETGDRCGDAPQLATLRQLIQNGTLKSTLDLEQWLLKWELAHCAADEAIAPLDTGYLDWYQPGSNILTLLLLPVEHGADVLAYLHWYAACTSGTPTAIQFLRDWHQRYGTELVCHYGTMLQFNVSRPPTTLEDAFQLAWEQQALAECTTVLPGISLRNHARALLKRHQWFLHERP